MPVGKNVVIIGGGIQGCELAEFLVKRNRRVTIINNDLPENLAVGMSPEKRMRLLNWFTAKGVVIMNNVKCEEIIDEGLTVATSEGERQKIHSDNIVLALPLTPNTALLRSLEGKVPVLEVVGDCHESGLILQAIADGFRTGHGI
jgi:pyruvate/2-oxoglutarate dehydrogenase complex dihydrolipoamide dehydrogenase (E3) component